MSLTVRVMRASILAVVLLVGPSEVRAQVLTLEITNGQVTLNAQGVSVRQILERWAAIGGVTIVNADKVGATLVTLQLSDVPEREALETLLRNVNGYLLGMKQEWAEGVTAIDRIVIAPTSSPARTVASVPASVPIPPIDSADESPFEPAIIGMPDVAVASPPDPLGGALAGATGSFEAISTPGVLTSPRQPSPPPRPAENPIRYLDQLDENGDRMRAPTTDPLATEPPSGTLGQGSKATMPVKPSIVTTGSSQPGAISPAPKPAQP